jgi:LuxR family quorum-sensing system transcriptional regulator CciR
MTPMIDGVTLHSGRQSVRRKLTHRQRECLLFVARGMTDRQIAQALSLSAQTVHKHIEAAKKTYAARTRMQLVIQALFAEELELTEVAN